MERHKRSIAIFVILRNEEGEYLLQRRKNTGYMDGYYDFAATGHLEADEAIELCAVREAKEEIGVGISPEDLELIHVSQTNVFGGAYIGFYFLCQKWEDEPKICEPHKCDDLSWFAADNFPEKLTTAVKIMQQVGFSEKLAFFYSNSDRPL